MKLPYGYTDNNKTILSLASFAMVSMILMIKRDLISKSFFAIQTED